MPLGSMEQGIKAIQAGNLTEGARLLKIALKDTTELTGRLRAVALTWLAETTTNRDQKITYYKEALAADPGNADVQQRMALVMALPPPPPLLDAPLPPAQTSYPITTAPSTLPQAPYMSPATALPGAPPVTTNLFFRTVGVMDGPNGPGTAFFVNQQGLLATTRFVVGGVEHLTIALEDGRTLPGRVVRSYPEFDVAIIQVDIQVSRLLPPSPSPTIPDNMALTAVAQNGQVMNGARAATKRDLAAHWFPTTIRKLADAGGNPIFDERNYLVGMLTRNMSRTSGYVFGLHIAKVYQCVDNYLQEIQLDSRRAYCPNCGYLSRAPSIGAFYCEACGGTLPYASEVARFPIPQAGAFYGENTHTPCKKCGSRLGYYNGRCLRCGAEAGKK